MNKDLYNTTQASISLAPVSISSDTATNGLIIDTLDGSGVSGGFESIAFLTAVGVVTAGDVTISIFESDDSGMSGEVAVAAANLIGAYATLDTSATTNYVGAVITKRYVRAKYTTDNSANLLVQGTAVLGHPHRASTQS